MENIDWIFQLRWFLWSLGIITLFFAFQAPFLAQFRLGASHQIDRNYLKWLTTLCSSFFILALFGKYSQLWTLTLNSQDFWLFTDMLEQMKKGGFFLTRFAPQDLGMIQHGTVHPMLSWALWLPFAYGLGSTSAALVFNPAMVSAAGFLVGLLSRKAWGNSYSLFFAAAFLASTQVGKILMYDVHPEVAYPFFVLLWLWALGLDGSKRVRWIPLVASTAIGIGIKEDSFLVFGPWFLWGIFNLKKEQRKGAFLATLVGMVCFFAQTWAVKNWVSGAWGPKVWEGSPVVTGVNLGVLGGEHWAGLHDIFRISAQVLKNQGGIFEILKMTGSFLISRPWLSLLIFAPWVVLQGRFWLVILPLAAIYSTLGSPKVLWNYYSAPFLGSFWFCAMVGVPATKKRKRAFWILSAALLLGSGSIQIFWPSPRVAQIKNEVQKLLPCLGNRGLVPSYLLGLVPLEKVSLDRVPKTLEQWDRLDFVLFAPNVGRFELPLVEAHKLYRELLERKDWKQVGLECEVNPQRPSERILVLFVRRA